jgi:peptide chain release factor 2
MLRVDQERVMRELHLTKKDFRVEWFSGTGAGGQYRNKHQNCCRITHVETGLVATGQAGRDRPTNQRHAFTTLAKKIVEHYRRLDDPERERIHSEVVVRNYHAERNEVLDKASGLRQPYRIVVVDGELGDMIEARKRAVEMGQVIEG